MTGARAQIRRPSILLIAVLALAGLALAGCGSSGGSGGSTSAAATKFVITIKDFGYTTPASVSPGATILVRNQDDTEHTVTADSGNTFDDQAPTGNSTFKAPTKPGSYPFHCTFHPEMHGTLVVK